MAKFELSLTTDYVPSWGLWEGLREIIQNAMDAQRDGHPMTIAHKGTTFCCSTHGVKLDRRIWLLGYTTKAADEQSIGKFGEGSAIGLLALLRAGHRVRIVNDDELWTPHIEPSSTFSAPVLTIRTRALSRPTGAFSIEVSGVIAEAWEQFREYFLHLTPAPTSFGSTNQILDGPAHAGRLYVKGIYVQELEGYAFGYNLLDVATDRDRKMVSAWMLDYKIALLWLEVVNDTNLDPAHRHRLSHAVFDGLNQGSRDFQRIADYASTAKVAPLVDLFHQRYGQAAVAIHTEAERREAEHHGITAISLDRALALTLHHDERTVLAKVIASRSCEVAVIHALDALSHRESRHLEAALSLLSTPAQHLGYPDIRARLQIVDFRGPHTLGQFHADGNDVRISIARRVLRDLTRTLQVLVHELAHYHGSDGDVRHERAEGQLFAATLAHLYEASGRSLVAI